MNLKKLLVMLKIQVLCIKNQNIKKLKRILTNTDFDVVERNWNIIAQAIDFEGLQDEADEETAAERRREEEEEDEYQSQIADGCDMTTGQA